LDHWTRISDLLTRLSSYSPWEVAVELVIIWVVIYAIIRFVQGTGAAGALKGLLVVLLVVTIASRVATGDDRFDRLSYLADKFLALVAVGLIVIFQPELRRALVRLGEAPFFRGTPPEIASMVAEIAAACKYLSKAKFGGLIVIERQVGLAGLVEEGTTLNADLNAQLLKTIFFPGSALHDLAVIVKGKSIRAAGVQLPLADPADMPDPMLGSRHRAALGLSKECDAVVVVVSEETGRIRLAERGRLSEPMTYDQFPDELTSRLNRGPVPIVAVAPDPMTTAFTASQVDDFTRTKMTDPDQRDTRSAS
jgi:diadenylate cyclase